MIFIDHQFNARVLCLLDTAIAAFNPFTNSLPQIVSKTLKFRRIKKLCKFIFVFDPKSPAPLSPQSKFINIYLFSTLKKLKIFLANSVSLPQTTYLFILPPDSLPPIGDKLPPWLEVLMLLVSQLMRTSAILTLNLSLGPPVFFTDLVCFGQA